MRRGCNINATKLAPGLTDASHPRARTTHSFICDRQPKGLPEKVSRSDCRIAAQTRSTHSGGVDEVPNPLAPLVKLLCCRVMPLPTNHLAQASTNTALI